MTSTEPEATSVDRGDDRRSSGASFATELARSGVGPLVARSLGTLQVNLGKLCNQACAHCHVEAGPHQTSAAVNMQRDVAEDVVRALESGVFDCLDLTGGAPELNANFRWLVESARALGVHVMDRCNLTVLFEPGQEDLAEFLAAHRVEVVASLPYYTSTRTDAQRGRGVFDRSIAGLLRLNELGYGMGAFGTATTASRNGSVQAASAASDAQGSVRAPRGLVLNLVYNPAGAYLPGPEPTLERDFKRRLEADWGIRFDRLFALTNMPIRRFLEWLQKSGNEASLSRQARRRVQPRSGQPTSCAAT